MMTKEEIRYSEYLINNAYNDGYMNAKKNIIDKACEWIENNLAHDDADMDAFRESMEE